MALPALAAAALLAWPVDCTPGYDCRVTNWPDPHRTGTTAFCRSNLIEGHEGTDIVVDQEQMDAGVAVYAAADGVAQWVFDGKYDRCPDGAQPDCREPAVLKAAAREGNTVCTALGPFCRDGPDHGRCFWCFAGGNVIVIRHPGGPVFATRYDHLKRGSILVKEGQRVKRGQKIAEVGSAGHSTAPHLHFEVWGKTFYDPVDPWAGPCSARGTRSLFAAQPDVE